MFRGLFYKRELTYIALIVVVALPLYSFFLSRYVRRKRLQQIIKFGVLLSYIFAIIYFTLLCKQPQNEPLANLTPFWSYSRFFEVDYQWQIYMNILLFIPFGFFLPAIFRKFKFCKVLLFAIAVSSVIEVTQYFQCLGLCEFDDVFHNTLGAVIGYGYWIFAIYIERLLLK